MLVMQLINLNHILHKRCEQQPHFHCSRLKPRTWTHIPSHDRRVMSASRNLLLSSIFSSITAKRNTQVRNNKCTKTQCAQLAKDKKVCIWWSTWLEEGWDKCLPTWTCRNNPILFCIIWNMTDLKLNCLQRQEPQLIYVSWFSVCSTVRFGSFNNWGSTRNEDKAAT